MILVTGHNPLSTYKAIFNGTGLNWFFPWVRRRRAHHRGAEPAADADPHHAADPVRARGGLRLPLRPVQHRRPGPVLRRHLRGRVGRVVVRRHAQACCTCCSRSWPRPWRARRAGHRRVPQGGRRRARGDLHDHAQLDRVLGRQLPLPRSTGRCRTPIRPSSRCRSPTTSCRAPSCTSSGAIRSSRACTSGASSRSGRLVVYWVDPLALDLRLRGARGRIQRRGRALRRRLGRAQRRAGHGDVRGLRGAGGATDMMGWAFQVATTTCASRGRLLGIAVALLGRNTASGIAVAALLFGALLSGTSQRNLDPTIFEPELATNLTFIIQGLVVLIVSPTSSCSAWSAAAAGSSGGAPAPAPAPARRPRPRDTAWPTATRGTGDLVGQRRLGGHRAGHRRLVHRAAARARAHARAVGRHRRDGHRRGGWALGGGERKLGWGAIVAGVVGAGGAVASTKSGVGNLKDVVTWSALVAATLRYATPLIFGALGGIVSERSGIVNVGLEGMMLMGAFFGIFGADLFDSWFLGLLVGMAAGGVLGLRSRLLLHPAARRPGRERNRAELHCAGPDRVRLPRPLRRPGDARQRPARPRRLAAGHQGRRLRR